MRRVRFLPPQSSYFFLSQGSYPSESGLIAPGMHVNLILRFAPDSLADYSDAFTIDTELARFTVPLTATRTLPALSLPQELSLGDVYIGNTLTREVTVEATSGQGTFRVVPADMWPDGLADAPLEVAQIGDEFTLAPVFFSAKPGAAATFTVTFTPEEEGERGHGWW